MKIKTTEQLMKEIKRLRRENEALKKQIKSLESENRLLEREIANPSDFVQ